MFGKHKGEDFVKGGTYLDSKRGEFVSFGREGGRLPYTRENSYVHMPVPWLFMFVPILGLGFLLSVPAIIIGGIVTAIRGRSHKTEKEPVLNISH